MSAHTTWRRTGAERHAEAYAGARAALLLGTMIHDRRVELGLTQAELAERAGMTQPQLSRLEGSGATLTVPLLARLAEALDAELDISFRARSAHLSQEQAMRSVKLVEELRELQTYGQSTLEAQGLTVDDLAEVTRKVLKERS
jgi:transcriptional regulator with XRE-family HTH domain